MSNLEELDLNLPVFVHKTFIDGNHLKKSIINCMPRLNQFKFYICSAMFIHERINLPSTEDVRHTFVGFPNDEIISYIDYFLEAKLAQCYIYSYPPRMTYYGNITNNYPGGLFQYVRVVSLFDEHPFEYEFFLRIQKSFPSMEILSVSNRKAQNHKQSYESN